MSPNPLSDFTLERYVLEELSPSEKCEVERTLARSPECRARLEDLRRANAAFLSEHPTLGLGKLPAPPSLWRRRAALTGVLVAVAAAMLITTRPPDTLDTREEVRLKGETLNLTLHVKSGQGAAHALTKGELAGAGDRLQVSYRSARALQGLIVSRDAKGQVTPHLSTPQGASLPLVAGKTESLAHSFELDATPGSEDFYFIASEKTFSVEDVREALARGTPELVRGNLAARGFIVEFFPVRKR